MARCATFAWTLFIATGCDLALLWNGKVALWKKDIYKPFRAHGRYDVNPLPTTETCQQLIERETNCVWGKKKKTFQSLIRILILICIPNKLKSVLLFPLSTASNIDLDADELPFTVFCLGNIIWEQSQQVSRSQEWKAMCHVCFPLGYARRHLIHYTTPQHPSVLWKNVSWMCWGLGHLCDCLKMLDKIDSTYFVNRVWLSVLFPGLNCTKKQKGNFANFKSFG